MEGRLASKQALRVRIQESDGNFHGVTFRSRPYDSGTIFKVSVAGVESALYSFTGNVNGTGGLSGSKDGGGANGLVQGYNDNFFGTTEFGGQYDEGTIFALTDPPRAL